MKKAAVLIAVMILSVFCFVPVSAAGNGMPTIGVYARSVYTLPDGCYGAEKDDDGKYAAQLPDGVKVTASAADPSLQMVIVPITERDAGAYRWISGCAASLGTELLFYEIYFTDTYGNRVDVNMPTEVSIALKPGTARKAAGIATDGRLSPLAAKSDNDQISFTIEKGGYYAVAAAKSGGNVSASDTPAAPETGDRRMRWPFAFLLFVSGAGIAGAFAYGKKKKHPAE